MSETEEIIKIEDPAYFSFLVECDVCGDQFYTLHMVLTDKGNKYVVCKDCIHDACNDD